MYILCIDTFFLVIHMYCKKILCLYYLKYYIIFTKEVCIIKAFVSPVVVLGEGVQSLVLYS